MYDAQVEKLHAAYRERRDALCDAVAREIPEATFEKPGGGFFLWVNLPESVDTQTLRARLPEQQVDFIHGARFFTDGRVTSSFRAAFSLYAPDDLREAVRRVRRAIG